MAAQPKPRFILEEYLELDKDSEARLEYWNGEAFDMSGSSPEHDAIESNLHHRLRIKLEGRGCRIFLANMRIKVPSAPPYRYGDASALCGQPQYERIGGVAALTNPALIVEILSDSTEAYDRGDKFTHYQSILSFSEYLLIAQHRPHVTQLVKQSDGSWTHREYNSLEEAVRLVSLDCEISLREIYQGLTVDELAITPNLIPLPLRTGEDGCDV